MYVLALTVMMWTAAGAYESKHALIEYPTQAACEQAKERAIAQATMSGQGVVASCREK